MTKESLTREPLTGQLLRPTPAQTIDHFSSLWLPPPLRTASYDRRALNGGANRAAPFSAEDHIQTPRWQNSQELGKRLLGKLTHGRFAITEGAIHNSGGGHFKKENHRIHHGALGYVVMMATSGVDVRVLPNGADLTGSAYGDFTLATYPDRLPALFTNDGRGTVTHNPQSVNQMIDNFNFMWEEQALPAAESVDYLREAQQAYAD